MFRPTQRCSSVMRNIEFQCRKCNIGPNFMSPTYHIHSMRTLPHSTFSDGHELFVCWPLFSFTSVPFYVTPGRPLPAHRGAFRSCEHLSRNARTSSPRAWILFIIEYPSPQPQRILFLVTHVLLKPMTWHFSFAYGPFFYKRAFFCFAREPVCATNDERTSARHARTIFVAVDLFYQ